MTSTSPTTGPDRWHHFGASSHGRRSISRLHWDWYQRIGPGAELLGDLAGRTVAELGAGAGHQAAYVAAELGAARVTAIDSSAAQHTRSRDFYGDVYGLEFVHSDAADHLQTHPGSLDVAYSIFGALDFSDPQSLLPSAAMALRPGGTLVFSTLAHYRTGAPPETECRPADIPTRMPDGRPGTMQRWVLEASVWKELLDEHGFDVVHGDTVHDPGRYGEAPVATTLFRARTKRRSGAPSPAQLPSPCRRGQVCGR
ncbi:class I SAM-dependent methyltransferase [Streptomyces sp. CS090A]|uniref:class I SAM-dependent methyltransferase n=1 Tax=Streptomyces sp. CS090A TaxID=2162710 RepID=UPI000D51D5D9|nr:class I SAM-dependent methyltransferase [Streptomyces sp. CS090A]PVC91484.1 class I SAM-dependent methyltransferase [Streptomyces sp. CS090A]